MEIQDETLSVAQCFQLKDFAWLLAAGWWWRWRWERQGQAMWGRIVSSKYKYLSLSSVLPAHNQPLPQPADNISSRLEPSLHITVAGWAGDERAQLRGWSCITGHPASQSVSQSIRVG